jgi:hypothetical protein
MERLRLQKHLNPTWRFIARPLTMILMESQAFIAQRNGGVTDTQRRPAKSSGQGSGNA